MDYDKKHKSKKEKRVDRVEFDKFYEELTKKEREAAIREALIRLGIVKGVIE